MAKRTKRKAPAPLVVLEPECAFDIRFSQEVRKDPETVRWLAYRVVDLLMDSGHHEWLADSVAKSLVAMGDEVVVNYVTELIREAGAPRKAVPDA